MILVDKVGLQEEPSEAEEKAGRSDPDLHSVGSAPTPSFLEEAYQMSDPVLHQGGPISQGVIGERTHQQSLPSTINQQGSNSVATKTDMSTLGTIASAVSALTTYEEVVSTAKYIKTAISPVEAPPLVRALGHWTLPSLGASTPYQPLATSPVQVVEPVIGKLGKTASVVSAGIGAYDTYQAWKHNDTGGMVIGSADTVASLAGLFGPIGGAFSGGYSGGQLLDKVFKITDVTSATGGWVAQKLAGSDRPLQYQDASSHPFAFWTGATVTAVSAIPLTPLVMAYRLLDW